MHDGGAPGVVTNPTDTVIDSAGVKIVINRTAKWTAKQGFRLADRPIFDIGAGENDPATQFERARAVHRTTEGNVVVWNHGTRHLRLFSPDGKLLAQAGGKGRGPGEFDDDVSAASVSVMRGDTIGVIYRMQGKVALFDRDLKYVGLVYPGDRQKKRCLEDPFSFLFEDGSILGTACDYPPMDIRCRPGVNREAMTFQRIDRSGRSAANFGRLWYYETALVKAGCGVSESFRPWASFAGRGAHLYFSEGRAYQFDEFDDRGRLVRSVRRSQPAPELTRADIETHITEIGGKDLDQAGRKAFEDEWLTKLPKVKAAIRGLLVDSRGNIWAGEYFARDEPRQWNVFDSLGRYLGKVTTPARFAVAEIGEDYVLGSWRDEDDVDHVRMYRLESR